jgi:hypothetical protein
MESIIKPNYSIFFGNIGYVKLLELINKNNYDKILILSDSNTLKYCLPILKGYFLLLYAISYFTEFVSSQKRVTIKN